MAKDLITDLVRSLGKQLNTEFGCTVYIDPQEQGVQAPCFFVELISSDTKRLLMGRVQYATVIRVKYLPEHEEYAFKEYYPILDRLRQTVELVTLSTGDILRGTQVHTDHTKSSLICTPHYNFVVQETGDKDTMDTMEVNYGTE